MMRQSRMSTRSDNSAPLSRGQLLALVGLFAVTALILILLDRGHLLDALKRPAERPLLALGQSFTGVGERLRHFGDRFGNVEDLRAENERLRAENARLVAVDARNKELELENKQLIAQANFAVKFPQYQSVPARIIGRDLIGTEKAVVIDRGSDDGIERGMPVVSPDFLVGLVTEVYPKRSKIRLIIDQDMQIGVLLQQDERGRGIMYGNWQAGGRLVVRYINRDLPVAPNAPIITSNDTLHVPQGLLIGFVTTVRKNEQGDTLEVDATPYVDFDSLESISVILTGER